MDVKEEQKEREKMIPVFTVLKNGAILKNIFIVNSRDFSSPVRNGDSVCDDDEVEETLIVGRHPDCDILLTHPSISRFHLEIRSVPSRQKLFVTDLSSVHGTWITDQKVEPDACVEVKEGDVIRIGGSTRIYRLHWIPLSRAYDLDNPFTSPFNASTDMEQEEDNRLLEAENLVLAHQHSLANTASSDDEDLHLDVTSEGTESPVPSEDEDTYITTREIPLPHASPSVLTLAPDYLKTQKVQFNEDLQTSTKWDVDVVEAPAVKPNSNCIPCNQRSGEGLGFSELEGTAEADECDVRGDGGLHLNLMSERMESSVPNEDENPYIAVKETSSLQLPTDFIKTEKLQLTEDVQASPELAVNIIDAKTENSSSGFSPSKGHIHDGCFEASGCAAFELPAEAEILRCRRDVNGETELITKQVMEASAEPLTKAEIQSHIGNKEIEVSRQVIAVSLSSSPQAEQLLEILSEDARGILGSEFQSEVSTETDSENLYKNSNEVKPAGEQNLKPGVNRETEKIFDEGSSSCFSKDFEKSGTQSFMSLANLKPETDLLIEDEGNTDKEVPLPSTFEDEKVIEELPSYYTESQENQTQQSLDVKDDATHPPFFDIHMEENVTDLHSRSSKSKAKHEPKKVEWAPFQPLQGQSYNEASSTEAERNNISRDIRSSSNLSDTKRNMKWTIVLDTSSLLDKESRKPLYLLQGLKGTHLVVPSTVIKELNEIKQSRSLLFRRRTKFAYSALDWIEDCKVNTKWWIQLQSPLDKTKATTPTTSSVTPQSNGSSASHHWNNNVPEVDSPTSADQVLECALLYRNDEKLVILSNDVNLKIKAMAEGVICETANEFYESLVNPLSERFMWRESLARGRTWSHLDDVLSRERHYNKKSTYNGGRREFDDVAKGLQLILLCNSHYGHIQ